jgi:hypothetical protein
MDPSQLAILLATITSAILSIAGLVSSLRGLLRKRDAVKAFQRQTSTMLHSMQQIALYTALFYKLSTDKPAPEEVSQASEILRNYLVHLNAAYSRELSSGLDQPSSSGRADYAAKLLSEAVSSSSAASQSSAASS